MLFVVVSWIWGIGLGIGFISNGIARFSGDEQMMKRKDRLGIDDDVFGLLAWAEVAAGTGLVLATLYGPEGAWPSLFHHPVWFPIGLGCVLALIGVRTVSIWYRRLVNSKLDDMIPSMILILCCMAFLIAFCSRQILLG